MSYSWAASFALEHQSKLAELRLLPDMEWCAVDDVIWLRGQLYSEEISARLAVIPRLQKYWVGDNDVLTIMGNRLPEGYLPKSQWHPMIEAVTVKAPVSHYAGVMSTKIKWKVARTEKMRPAKMILVDLESFQEHCETISEIRLRQWKYAANETQAFVVGDPLPSISGRLYSLENSVALPLGWSVIPSLALSVLSKIHGVTGDDVLVLDEQGQALLLEEYDFVPVSRYGLREMIERYHG